MQQDPSGWSPWDSSQGTQHCPSSFARCSGPGDAKAAVDDLHAAWTANQVHDSIEALAGALQAQLAALAGAAEFLAWQRADPQFKPPLSEFFATATGVRHVTVL